MEINFNINGESIKLNVSPKKRLLDILRDDLNLIATKEGCGKGECGACTVLMNGKQVNSCLVPALQLPESRIITLEGLQNWAAFHAIEKAYVEHGAVQCGFCISGFIMSTAAMLVRANFPISSDLIQQHLSGNLCRCTGYSKIIEAVQDLSRQAEIIQMIKQDWQNAFGVE